MQELATNMLAVYFFGKELCVHQRHTLVSMRLIFSAGEDPAFLSALYRYYRDVMAFGAAIQFLPTFMHS